MKSVKGIAALIAEGESQTVEFKTSFERETIETLVAFANTRGGRVLVGVADNGGYHRGSSDRQLSIAPA